MLNKKAVQPHLLFAKQQVRLFSVFIRRLAIRLLTYSPISDYNGTKSDYLIRSRCG